MSFFELVDVSFTYPNDFTAVENVSIEFKKGESVAIIGQNGAGKTTIAKMMNGLLKPTTGDVIIDNMNTKDYTTAQLSSKVGYVFQNPDDQIFHDDVYSEIEFGPKNLKLDSEVIKERVLLAAELVGLDNLLDESPQNLPYSTRKFVTIASVIAMEPDIIILDEPTAGQDPVAMQRLSAIIDHLTENDKTVLTITHDMEFVVGNFERVIVMANKKKIADDSKRSVFWNFDVLDEGMLKQPYISSLSNKLEMNGNILSIMEIIEKLKSEKKIRTRESEYLKTQVV